MSQAKQLFLADNLSKDYWRTNSEKQTWKVIHDSGTMVFCGYDLDSKKQMLPMVINELITHLWLLLKPREI